MVEDFDLELFLFLNLIEVIFLELISLVKSLVLVWYGGFIIGLVGYNVFLFSFDDFFYDSLVVIVNVCGSIYIESIFRVF